MGNRLDSSSGEGAADSGADRGVSDGGYDQQLTNETIESMKRTRPYVLFLAVMGVLGAIVFILGSFSTMYAGYRRGDARSPNVGMITLMAGVMMMVFSMGLMNYGKRLTEFLSRPNAERLDTALGAQQRFWRTLGIAGGVGLLIVIVLYAVLFVRAVGAV